MPTASTNGTRSPDRNNGAALNGAARDTNVVDALAMDDMDRREVAAEDIEMENTQRRRRAKMRGQIDSDVPLVRDALGEQITESFETFLRT
jgi:DNA replication licensing factor MCM6